VNGEVRAAFSKAFARSKREYKKIMAAGKVDRKSLDNLERGLDQKLEFNCSILLAKLRNKNLEPAMEEVKASGVRMVRVIQASTGFPDPLNVAIVTPVNAERGSPPDCRSNSTSRQSDTGRKGSLSRLQENSNDRRQGALVGELTSGTGTF
jgi:hypothetical protein